MVQFILVSYSYSYSILHQIYKQITIADIADKDEHSNVQKRKQYEQGNQSNKMEKWNPLPKRNLSKLRGIKDK